MKHLEFAFEINWPLVGTKNTYFNLNLGTQWDLAEVSLQVGYHGIDVSGNITCVRIEGIIIMDLWIRENSWKNISNHNLRLFEILAL